MKIITNLIFSEVSVRPRQLQKYRIWIVLNVRKRNSVKTKRQWSRHYYVWIIIFKYVGFVYDEWARTFLQDE